MSTQNKLHVSDEQLFTINLFSAFVNNNHIKTDRNEFWQKLWNEGIEEAEALGLHSSIMSPIMMIAINQGLGNDYYSNWFIPNYNKFVQDGLDGLALAPSSFLNFLNPSKNKLLDGIKDFFYNIKLFNNSKNKTLDGIKLKDFFYNIKLNEKEKKIFNKFIIIKELKDTIIISLYNEILRDKEMIKCFIENFTIITAFSKKKTYKIYFIERKRIKLFRKYFYFKKKIFYEYEEIIYEILTKNFNEYRIEELMDNYNYIKVDLNNFYIENFGIRYIIKIWNEMNEDITLSKL